MEVGRARVSWLDRLLRAESVSGRHKEAYRAIRRGVVDACPPALAEEVGGPGEYYDRADVDPRGPMPPYVVDVAGIPMEVPKAVEWDGDPAGAAPMGHAEAAAFEQSVPVLRLVDASFSGKGAAEGGEEGRGEGVTAGRRCFRWASGPAPDPFEGRRPQRQGRRR